MASAQVVETDVSTTWAEAIIRVKDCKSVTVKIVTDLQSFTLMMASAQVVETSVNTNNSPSQDYTTNPDDHSNHNINKTDTKVNNYLIASLGSVITKEIWPKMSDGSTASCVQG